ncbi:MAG TPA: hypothetical protein VF306_09120, partial [Pirellulales bacterium]
MSNINPNAATEYMDRQDAAAVARGVSRSRAEGRQVDEFGFSTSAGHKRYAMRAELVEVVENERSYARLTASDGSYALAEIPRGTTVGGVLEMIHAAFHRVEESRAGEAVAFSAYDAPFDGHRRTATIGDCAAAIEKLTEYFDRDGNLNDDAKMACSLARAELGPLGTLDCLWAD